MANKKHFRIYSSPIHLASAFFVVLLPLIFLVFFSQLSHIDLHRLLNDVAISLLRILIAYLIAAVLGWITAVTFYKGRVASVALPIFDILQSFPTFAALPLVVYLWGESQTTIIIFLVLAIIWPIFFSIVSSLKLVRSDWEEVVKISQLSGLEYFKKFLWPATVPGLITGSIIGLGEGWEVLVATEIIVMAKTGLGEFFNVYSHNYPITLLGILGFLLIIFAINNLVWLPLLEYSHRLTEE
jgi:ABC-type nitrate/sulfonate/bicarbonate transport system permease component